MRNTENENRYHDYLEQLKKNEKLATGLAAAKSAKTLKRALS